MANIAIETADKKSDSFHLPGRRNHPSGGNSTIRFLPVIEHGGFPNSLIDSISLNFLKPTADEGVKLIHPN